MQLFHRSRRPLLVAAALLIQACDQAPGHESPEGEPPVLSELSFEPTALTVRPDAPDVVSVPLTMSVHASDADGDIDEVLYVVQPPSAGGDVVAEGSLSAAGGGRFEAEAELSISKGEIGVYTVLVYSVDEEGSLSNTVRGNLRFLGAGAPPVIERVDADPEIVRPPTTLTLVATVSDPDGLINIARVFGTTPNGSDFQMSDDGQSLGDQTAGDGRYTATFDVPSATPGTQTFSFQAEDKAGLTSDVFTKDIEVQ